MGESETNATDEPTESVTSTKSLTDTSTLYTSETETWADAPWMAVWHKPGRKEDSVLFEQVQGSLVIRSLKYMISLSSVLIFTLAAFIACAVYRWWFNRDEYAKLSDPQSQYQSA